MGQYWHIALKRRNLNVRIDPAQYGEGLKFLEFAFAPTTLLVYHDLLRGDWFDCPVALVGDCCTSEKGLETCTYPAGSLLELGLTEVNPHMAPFFKTKDDATLERFGCTRLKSELKIRTNKFYVINATKQKYVVIDRKKYDAPECVAALSWLLVDETSMGKGFGDIKPETAPELMKTMGCWAFDRIRVLDDEDFLEEVPSQEYETKFDKLLETLKNFY